MCRNISHVCRLIDKRGGDSEKEMDGNSDLGGTTEDVEPHLSAEVGLSYTLSDDVTENGSAADAIVIRRGSWGWLAVCLLPLLLVHDVDITFAQERGPSSQRRAGVLTRLTVSEDGGGKLHSIGAFDTLESAPVLYCTNPTDPQAVA